MKHSWAKAADDLATTCLGSKNYWAAWSRNDSQVGQALWCEDVMLQQMKLQLLKQLLSCSRQPDALWHSRHVGKVLEHGVHRGLTCWPAANLPAMLVQEHLHQ